MRPLLLIAALILWISIMAINCGDCQRPFKTARGLNLHRNSCRARQIQLTRMSKASRRHNNTKKSQEYRSPSPGAIRPRKRARTAEAEEQDWRDRIFGPEVSAYSLSACMERKPQRPPYSVVFVYMEQVKYHVHKYLHTHISTRLHLWSQVNALSFTRLPSLHPSLVPHASTTPR